MNFGRAQPLRVVDVPLRQRVDMRRLRRILDWHERRVAPEPVNARREFVDGRPVVTEPVLGVELRQPRATRGTPAPETVGRRSSHGCIRLRIQRVEWLYNVVDIGTPVVIV